jgi:hypothetical protein
MTTESVVPLYANENNEYLYIGTGFFVTDSLLVTAAHVVRDGGKYILIEDNYILLENAHYDYRTEEGPLSNDLALLKLTNASTSVIPFSISPVLPEKSAKCHLIAYKVISPKHNQKVGLDELTSCVCEMAFEGFHRTINKIWLFTPGGGNPEPVRGMSGGPIINEDRKVVGVFYSAMESRNPTDSYAWDYYAISCKHLLKVVYDLTDSKSNIVIN